MKALVSLCLFLVTGLLAGAQITVGEGSVEYLTNPLGIDTREPRLSWIISGNERDIRQTAYQLFVASSAEKTNEGADVWNSGKIVSDSSVGVVFRGGPLVSAKRYFWRVRVWDQKGDSATMNEPAYWEMGLLTKEDWKGRWLSAPKVYDWQKFVAARKAAIKAGTEEDPDPAPEFRKTFSFSKEIAQARLYLSGVGYNVPYINGQKVGDHVLDPAVARYDKSVLYSTYDVTSALHPGENVLGVVLGNGWYNMITKAVWGFDHAPWRNAPAVIAQLEIVFRDGTHEIVCSDESWKVAPGPTVFNSIRQGESYDARKETPGWSSAGFDDRQWFRPVVVAGPAGVLRAQMMPPIRITDTLIPRSIAEAAPGIYVFDMGRNIAGFAELRIDAPAGTEITMKYGERLSADGRVDQRDIAQHVAGGVVQTDKYICKGGGVEVWHPAFSYYGFQYVEVSGLPVKPDQTMITGMTIHTAFEPAGNFQCSNALFNKIQRNAIASYQSNFMGYPTDCPQREKNGWTADAHLAAEMGLYNFKAQNGYSKWLGDIADEQRPTGELSAIVPSSGWGYFWGNGPAWDNAMVLIPWYLYEYAGDRRILWQMYPHIKRYVDYLGTRAKDHIVSWGLGDWAPAKTHTPQAITSTAYYYVDAMLLSKMAGICGFDEDRKTYSALAGRIKDAFNKHYYRGKGIYGERGKGIDDERGKGIDDEREKGIDDAGSQTSLACALYQGLGDEHRQETVDALVAAIHKNDDHLDCGILGTKYLLHALSDNGRADLAYKIVNQHSFPGWGYWIDQGATTLWEQWNGTESRNHIMFGDVSAWFYETLAGIAPDMDQPGFKRIIFHPYFAPELNWVKASHQSLYGEISAEWSRKAGVVYYKIAIPANTTGEVILPGGKKISIDGKSPSAKKIILGSGSYTIKIK